VFLVDQAERKVPLKLLQDNKPPLITLMPSPSCTGSVERLVHVLSIEGPKFGFGCLPGVFSRQIVWVDFDGASAEQPLTLTFG